MKRSLYTVVRLWDPAVYLTSVCFGSFTPGLKKNADRLPILRSLGENTALLQSNNNNNNNTESI